MKRDLELCRKMLLAVEADQSPFAITGYSLHTLAEHVRLLNEAGFVEVIDLGDMAGDDFRLTCAGHEFLAAARNESVWQAVRGDLRKKAADVPFSVLAELLKRGTAALFGL